MLYITFLGKGQATIFMILGVLLVFLTISAVFLMDTAQDTETQVSISTGLEGTATPIENFVTQCLQTVSRSGIHYAGEQGGYTDISELDININSPTNSDAITLAPPGSANPFHGIPYFWHMKSPDGCVNNCQFNLEMLELTKGFDIPSIEEQIEAYINENLEFCLDSFTSFTDRGYEIRELSDPESEVTIGIDGASFNVYLNYPIEVQAGENVFRVEDYYTSYNIDLARIYALALEITLLQKDFRFIERQALNLLSLYGNIDGEIPPFTDTTFDFGSPGNMWTKTNVRNAVREVILKYTPFLRVTGTANDVSYGTDELSEKMYDTYMRIDPIGEFNYDDLEVYFQYLPIWPMYFDMNCDGEVCRAESFSSTLMTLIGVQRYRFAYSLSYPVLVRIRDPSAFNDEGFDFYFALEANIHNNEPLEPGSDWGFEYNVVSGETMLCSASQMNSGEHTFTVVDRLTEQPVENVAVMYSCGGETCSIGNLADGTYSGRLPICLGGTLSVFKEDYVTTQVPLSTFLDEDRDLGEVYLDSFRTRNFTLRKLPIVKPAGVDHIDPMQWETRGITELSENQEAVVILTLPIDGMEDHMQVVMLSHEEPIGQAELVPGTYEIEVIMFDGSEIIIPNRTDRVNVIGSLVTQRVHYPKVEFNETSMWMLGNMRANFTISPLMDDTNTVILIAPALELGMVPEERRMIEDLEIQSLMTNYTDRYMSSLGFRYE
ncbi:MAG: hypothetical protein ACMXYE_02845 [Candidatus Woesearchaeota archaeon]